MAADHADKPGNGTYGAHQSYGQHESYQATQASNPSPAPINGPAATASNDADEKPIPKEMIGWYFVEQYYNTMSKDPKSLFLYYTKRSQFVSGDEAEKVQVAVGQKAISERIKELDIQDCKVRVSNVDTQESFKNILVQVIGEMSNKAAPHRKFVQTFVLAEQPTGYFVLNDIFRYIIEEEDEIENGEAANDETTPSAPPPEAEATTLSSVNPAQQQHAAEQVDKKLEEEALQKTTSLDSTPTDVTPADRAAAPEAAAVNHAEDAPVAAIKESGDTTENFQKAAESVAVEEEAQFEKPRDPEPTPVASPPKPTKAVPAQTQAPAAPTKPAAPKTWANLVAANRTAGSAVPNGAAPAAVPAPSKAKPGPSSAKESATPPTSTNDESPVKIQQQNGNTGWQMAGSENKKQQGRQHSQSVSSSQENVLGYVKGVTDKVDASILKETLNHFGKLVYFDVSRQKNCAFVEFADSAAYAAAVAANPHSIGGEQIFVEERRPRGNAYGGNFGNRGSMRGGRGGTTDRPGSQGRGGFTKDGGRGGYGPRTGRGGAITPRGRGGQPQAA